jgi:hypothetical protein
MTSREGRRSSSRVPSAGASARGTKSIGTNQLRPSLTGGAGSETTRPAAEARAWLAVSVIVCVLVEMVRPPASASFTRGEIEQPGQIVEREHLLAADEAYGQRPPRVPSSAR